MFPPFPIASFAAHIRWRETARQVRRNERTFPEIGFNVRLFGDTGRGYRVESVQTERSRTKSYAVLLPPAFSCLRIPFSINS